MYLLKETLDKIKESGHTVDDVLYVGNEDGTLQLPWPKAEGVLEVSYDNGYGTQKIASDLCVRFKDGGVLIRCECDGAEWWRHVPMPATHGKPFTRVQIKAHSSDDTLVEINNDEMVDDACADNDLVDWDEPF